MFIKFPRENTIFPLQLGKGYINTLRMIYPLLDVENHLCQREIHPKSLLNNHYIFNLDVSRVFIESTSEILHRFVHIKTSNPIRNHKTTPK
jgi:hypothetical protein